MGQLNELFGQQPYLTGTDFSAADVAVGAILNYIPMLVKEFDFSPYPHVVSDTDRLKARDAYARS